MSPWVAVVRGPAVLSEGAQVFALLVTCLSQGECILPCVFTMREISGVERNQNLNARDGGFGRSKAERGQWFREKSVSAVDMQPSSWVYRGECGPDFARHLERVSRWRVQTGLNEAGQNDQSH